MGCADRRAVGIRRKPPGSTRAAQGLMLLDNEAISAVAHGPPSRCERMRALITEMRARNRPIATVAAVLAEVVGGRAEDAGVFAGLRRERVEVYPVDTRTGVRAGQRLGRINAGSELAVDAFVVAAADLAGGAIVASVDVADLERLAAHATSVVVTDIV
jgi:predicted nucleic acid-binding protein